MCIVTELVTMKSAEGITKEGFISIVNDLERNFHSKQSGFIDTELIYDEKNSLWIMLQHWETVDQLKAASAKILKDSASKSFVKSIDSRSVKITIAQQIKLWK